MSTSDLYKVLFTRALRIRLVEEAIIHIYPSDKIQSPVHLSIGQEAVAVALCNNLNIDDKLFSTYRSHAFYLAKGGCLKQMMAELYGRLEGCCKGKGGSMHLSAPEVSFMGTSAIVASSISHAVGAALAEKIKCGENISVAVFGEGATEEGVYHESLNYAALKQLPVLFVVENNGYAIHSPVSSRHSYKIAEHAKQYGITTHKIAASFDPVVLEQHFRKIITEMRRNCRPVLIEVDTYRYMEHVGIAEDYQHGYRSREELEECLLSDVLVQDREMIAHVSPELREEIKQAIEFAESATKPQLEQLLEDVY